MSRKDTVLVAVLINAGLLIVLFATALKPKLMEDHYSAMQQTQTAPKAHFVPAQDIGPAPIAAVKRVEVPLLPPPPPKKEVSNFAADLNAFAMEKPQVKVETKPVAPQPKAEPAFRTVVVKQGDFLERIAKRNSTSVSQLMRDNNLRSTTLQIGQKLKVSSSGGSAIASRHSEFYTVESGDNPWTIAKKNGIRVSELLKLNDLDDYAAKRLKPGDKLRIR